MLPTTQDALLGGRVRLLQPARGHGYRVNVDSVLLASFAAEKRQRVRLVVDLGAGTGAVSLCLTRLIAVDRLCLYEMQEPIAALARANLAQNGLEEVGSVYTADLNLPFSGHPGDALHAANLVVANPPFTPASSGRLQALRDANSLSRHGSVLPFVQAASQALGRRGCACFVYPAAALAELLEYARDCGIRAKRIRFVHGTPARPARIALVELVHGRPGGLVVLPPLIEFDAAGKRTAEVTAILGGPLKHAGTGDVARSDEMTAPLEEATASRPHLRDAETPSGRGADPA